MSSVVHHSQNTGEQHLLFMCIPLSARNCSITASYPGTRGPFVLILRMQSSRLVSNTQRCADNVASTASKLIWAIWIFHTTPNLKDHMKITSHQDHISKCPFIDNSICCCLHHSTLRLENHTPTLSYQILENACFKVYACCGHPHSSCAFSAIVT